MKVIGKVISWILTGIILILLTYNIYRLICLHVLKKDMAPVFGYAMLEVATGSMEPTLQVGDLIMIDTNAKDYQKGDIVTFYDKDGAFVTHRIVSITKETVVTKGDNNNIEDKSITIDQLVGKYVYKLSKGQKLIDVFRKPFMIMLVLFDGILFSIFMSIDKHGNIILDEEEQEYEEFKEYLKKKKK